MPLFKKIKRAFDTATKAQRALAVYGGLQRDWKNIRDGLPDGDGHPVLVLPGFLLNDQYNARLQSCIAEKGYNAYGWAGGFNTGLNEDSAQHLRDRLHEIYAANGGKKVSLVGYSLGGVYARELAREFPDMVRDVITMGSPFNVDGKADPSLPSRLRTVYEFFNPGNERIDAAFVRDRSLTPPPVPTTSIYSKSDAVVGWTASLNPDAPKAENIEVSGSHMGLPFNPLAIAAVLDRLAQKEGAWKPFTPPPSLKKFYPAPVPKHALPKNPGFRPAKRAEGRLFRETAPPAVKASRLQKPKSQKPRPKPGKRAP
jgi:pimeloyl-ACP methyl ester carboxylesterase